MGKRGSSSSEDEWIINSSDEVNNSDETMDEDCANGNVPKARPDVDTHEDNGVLENKIEQFISEQRRRSETDQNGDDAQLSTSGWHDERRSRPRDNEDQRRRPTHNERAEEVVHEAEAARARIFDIQGKKADITYLNDKFGKLDETTNFMHLAMVDENYLLVAAHLEEGLQKRIIRGEYIDFGKLLPRD